MNAEGRRLPVIYHDHSTLGARTIKSATADRGGFPSNKIWCSSDVIGISLLSPCTFRMRRKRDGGWERAALRLDRRSVYLLRGPSREEWQHSIPAVEELRYSVTFRSVRDAASR